MAACNAGDLTDREIDVAVRDRLVSDPERVDAWQLYSYDKRSTPNPHLEEFEVGHYDGGRKHVRHHPTLIDACADFVVTELRWAVDRRVRDVESATSEQA